MSAAAVASELDQRIALHAEINRLRKELGACERALATLEPTPDRIGSAFSQRPESLVRRNYRADTPSSSLAHPAAFRTAILATRFVSGAKICAVAGTGSMEPVFGRDAYLLLEPAPFDSLQEGDIVTYRQPGSEYPIVHRLVRKYRDKFVAKGDNNAEADPDYVTRENYLMRVFGIVYTRSDAPDPPIVPENVRTAAAAIPATPPEIAAVGVK